MEKKKSERIKGRLKVEKGLLTNHLENWVLEEELGEQTRVSAGNPFGTSDSAVKTICPSRGISDSAVKLSAQAEELEKPFRLFICRHCHCDSEGIFRRSLWETTSFSDLSRKRA